MPVMTYLEAISLGLREEMQRNPDVFLIGEDIGVYGGAFKVTKGFLEEFGADRVMDTPISEAGIIGVCVGSALMGLRPVAEMQFADFISCGFIETSLPLEENSDDFVFDNEMLAQIAYAGFVIGEVTCPTKYFDEASSINFKRSVVYGMGVLRVSLAYRLNKWGLLHSHIFNLAGGKKLDITRESRAIVK